ncbi:MAG TPA: tRNA (adenosine(37)-N6)-threonylcarbamoyltransferase complex transferase subunit TsaD, partial [Ktedonobacteraceae bacterium]|nr:tRNA (adenosine(37)-N6)-threonylcarbamoyltransferase complex transferase subunit TsaD [Ktedonobacteraceae bacterium]
NHLEAHIYANWLRVKSEADVVGSDDSDWEYQEGDPIFPLICLVISGAHSELVLVRGHGQYELLGRTRDDAAGEAFDKVARILGLSYPGGPAIQKAAQHAHEELQQQGKSLTQALNTYRLPRSWLRGTYDFSFSGLKTAVLHLAEGAAGEHNVHHTHSSENSGKQISQYTRMGVLAAQRGGANVELLAASFQEAVVDVLAVKTRLAAQEYHVKQVVLAGGVAANIHLRGRLERELGPLHIRLKYPPIEFCTDNAAMIASAAFFHLLRGEQHGLDLDVEPGLSLPFSKK